MSANIPQIHPNPSPHHHFSSSFQKHQFITIKTSDVSTKSCYSRPTHPTGRHRKSAPTSIVRDHGISDLRIPSAALQKYPNPGRFLLSLRKSKTAGGLTSVLAVFCFWFKKHGKIFAIYNSLRLTAKPLKTSAILTSRKATISNENNKDRQRGVQVYRVRVYFYMEI